jgi:hypothetical protein
VRDERGSVPLPSSSLAAWSARAHDESGSPAEQASFVALCGVPDAQ